MRSEGIPSLTSLRRQEVADFLEQHLRPRWCRRCRLLAYVETRQHLDQPKDRKADDQKLDHGVEKDADVQGHGTGLLRVCESRLRRALQGNKDVGEVDAADGQADDRGEDVLDQAVHHRGEGDADNDADGEVDHVAAHDEGTKLVDPTRPMHAERYGRAFAHRYSPLSAHLGAADLFGECLYLSAARVGTSTFGKYYASVGPRIDQRLPPSR